MLLAQTQLQEDWLSHYLFESPWQAITVLAIAWAALRIVGRRTNNPKLQRACWIPAALIPVFWLSAELVTTKPEMLKQSLQDLIAAVQTQDEDAFNRIVSDDAKAVFPPNHHATPWTKPSIQQRLKQAKITSLTLFGAELAVIGNNQAATVIRIKAQGQYAGADAFQIQDWAIQWRYKPQGWQATHFECKAIGLNPMQKKERDPAPK